MVLFMFNVRSWGQIREKSVWLNSDEFVCQIDIRLVSIEATRKTKLKVHRAMEHM